MPVRLSSRYWLLRKRQIYANSFLSLTPLRTNATNSEAARNEHATNTNGNAPKLDHGPKSTEIEETTPELEIQKSAWADSLPPTPAQFFRYALTGTTQTSQTRYQPWSLLDSRLENEWSIKTPNPTPLDLKKSLHGKLGLAIQNLSETRNLSELQVDMTHICTINDAVGSAAICETLNKAILRCEETSEYDAILATMNSLLVWLKKSGMLELRDFYILGMQYASLCFSPEALKHYIREYQSAGHGTFTAKEARLLVETLHKAVRLSRWENPERDTAPMLQAVTGFGGLDGTKQTTSATLHSHLPWKGSSVKAGDFVHLYVTILGHLGDVHTLAEIWSKITRLQDVELADSVSRALSSCLLAFIEAGDPQKAIRAVHDISSDGRLNTLVTQAVWRKLLEHDYNGTIKGLIGERELDGVFGLELLDIESRLGVKWAGVERGWHVEAKNAAIIPTGLKEENLATLDDENLGLESTPRLLVAVKNRGSSRSMADLSVIVDLLHGHEGREIPLGCIDQGQDGVMQVAWFPHCSPVEFSGSPTPAGNDLSSPCSLGLVRARPDYDGVPFKTGRSLFLMQLGYLSVRKKHALPGPHDDENPWRDTGHIVTWDRVNEKFLILFTGTAIGTIPVDFLQPSTPPSYLHYTSATLTIDNEPPGYDSSFTHLLEEMHSLYWINVDPGLAMKS